MDAFDLLCLVYDLRRDPSELHNFIDEPAYTGILAQLRNRMLEWYQANLRRRAIPYGCTLGRRANSTAGSLLILYQDSLIGRYSG